MTHPSVFPMRLAADLMPGLVAYDDPTAEAARTLLSAAVSPEEVVIALLRHVDHRPVLLALAEQAEADDRRARLARAFDLDPDDVEALEAAEDLLAGPLAPVVPLQRRA